MKPTWISGALLLAHVGLLVIAGAMERHAEYPVEVLLSRVVTATAVWCLGAAAGVAFGDRRNSYGILGATLILSVLELIVAYFAMVG